jgi:hypothetical protein
MAKRRQELLQRRRILLDRIAGQREQLAETAAVWQTPLHFADQAWLAVNFLRAHAVLVAGVAGLVLIRRRGVSSLVKGGFRIWKLYRYFNEVSAKLKSRSS